MPAKKKHKISVHNIRRVEPMVAVANEPQLIDFVVATCILAKRQSMPKEELSALVEEVFDELEG